MDRNEAISRIRAGLKRRSGKAWSVTGGRGTAWGWICIDAPPARCTARFELPEGLADRPENYREVDTFRPGGHMTPADREFLGRLLNKDTVHFQGESIPASDDYYQEYVDRAEGRAPTKIGTQYWD